MKRIPNHLCDPLTKLQKHQTALRNALFITGMEYTDKRSAWKLLISNRLKRAIIGNYFGSRRVHGTLIAVEWVMTFQKWAELRACGRPQRPQTS